MKTLSYTSYDFLLLNMCSWHYKPLYTQFQGQWSNLNISENWRVDPQLYIVWIFIIFSGSWHPKTPLITNLKFNKQSWNFSENPPKDPQFYIIGIFCCQIWVQQAPKPRRTNFERKNRASYWKTYFQLSKFYTNEIGPKSKKGETKKWKHL